jgi:hypothetical protein
MAVHQSYPGLEALRKLEASLNEHLCQRGAREQHDNEARCASQLIRRLRLRASPRLRKLAVVAGAFGAVVFLAMTALWWRLSSGPIELDVATPWLTMAIGENFAEGHQVEIGGTQLERDAAGRISLRIREIVVRDAEGTVVASAPKAEVGISGWALFIGRIRAERLSLVGAEMAVRIESDSQVTVFAGGDKRPFVTASASSSAANPPGAAGASSGKRERAGAPAPSAAPARSTAPTSPAPAAAAPAAPASAASSVSGPGPG